MGEHMTREVGEHRLLIQAETVRGEGRWWYVECATCRERVLCSVIGRYDGESAFIGSRARQRAERAMQLMTMEGSHADTE